MNKIVLVPGTRFGRLTVLEEAESVNHRRYWKCRCDCGNEKLISQTHLISGHTHSCGCLAKENLKKRYIDLTGRRFGRLVAVSPTEKRIKSSVVWRCICDCGRQTYCESEDLIAGRTKSCGCLREDIRKQNMAKAIHFVEGTCVGKSPFSGKAPPTHQATAGLPAGRTAPGGPRSPFRASAMIWARIQPLSRRCRQG